MNTYYAPKDDYKKDMGDRLHACRIQAKLTQEKMAETLGVSPKHYSEVERGVTGLSISKTIFLSNFFGVSLDYLLKGESNTEALPFPLVNLYNSCPDAKKEMLLDTLRNLADLMGTNISDNDSTDHASEKNGTNTAKSTGNTIFK